MELKELRELLALQRLYAREGFNNGHRVSISILKDEAVMMMAHHFGSYEKLLDFYIRDAAQAYKEVRNVYPTNGPDQRRALKDRGLQKAPEYVRRIIKNV